MEKYLLIQEAADMLGVSKYTLYGWDKTGKFVPDKIEKYTKTRLYSVDQVERILEEHGGVPKFKRGPKKK